MEKRALTSPILAEKRTLLTEGEIVLRFRKSILFKVAKITYERFLDGEFQYSFAPYYDVIDGLPSSIFQGIPGLDLSLRRPVYWRVNTTPVYVSERSPSENREGLPALLKAAGMEYLNRLEWMLRTDYSYMGDSFITLPLDYAYATEVENKNLLSFLSSVLKLLGSRAEMEIRGVHYEERERPTLIKAFLSLYLDLTLRMASSIQKGQREAEDKGLYKGRKPLLIDLPLLLEMTEEGKSEREIAKALRVSRTTLYRFRKKKAETGGE